ncbi:CLIP-associating protein 1 [Entomophthora muscae]|uniref:CLIP-associating protein 1 n=1 Tax=Entomophthora muscae TaxID=34485 RepID=A0ACC2T4H0_9FUNG|nr:CLIP-associating protein 1 [Entomophthora muscae]
MTFSTACSSTLFQLSLYFNKVVDSVENWRKVKDSLVSIKDIFTSTAAVHTNFSADVATISTPLVKCINSDCTDLAKEAIVLSAFLSCELKSGFATHVNQFCPALIQTLGKTNKILSSQGFAALSTIIANVKSIFVVHQICSATICTNFIACPLSAKLFLQLIDSFSVQILLKGCNDIEKVFSQGLSDLVLHIKEAYCSAF